MIERTWEDGSRTTLVCIDAFEDGIPTGRFYTPQISQGRAFHGLTRFLQEMEHALDEMELPSTFAAMRSFSPRKPLEQCPPPPGGRRGKVATFALRILFRQNVSWQGSVAWLEGRQEQSFRSALELVLLMSDAMQGQEAG